MKTPLDPLVALSFAVQSNPGVYAVLLGSGISKAAQIPTGWDVLVDLTRRVALASGVPDPTDPEAWYHDTFGEDPSYSALLQRLGKTRAERRALLHAYFEPTPEEEAQGRKQPTAAHKAIARLAGSGHIRVVLTTNFDRLMERSLEAEGIQPLVISASGGIDGATPLRHAPCTVIKVHGDYQDARIKNTPDELASFDPKMKRLLAQVLDEYGLIVCGWSAEWDTGLRSCIEAARSRRYTTFWAARSDLTDAARRLVKLRDATLVPTTDADQFFGGLADKVDALTQFAAPHPLSPKIAEATLKQHLSEPDKHRIRIHDLIHAEVDRVIAATRKEQMPLNGPAVTAENTKARVEQYEVVVTTLVRLLVTGVVWGPPELLPTWSGALERVATCQQDGGTILWLRLRRYPGLLLMYAAGLAAVVTGNYRALQSILLGTKARIEGDEKVPLVQELYPQAALDRDWANTSLFNSERKYVPVSERIFAYLRDQFRPWLPDDDDYQLAFDRFEFMLAMTYSAHGGGTFAPAGRFIHTWRYRDQRPRIAFEISDEIAAQGDMWLPILARLFPNKESALEAIKAVRELVGRWG